MTDVETKRENQIFDMLFWSSYRLEKELFKIVSCSGLYNLKCTDRLIYTVQEKIGDRPNFEAELAAAEKINGMFNELVSHLETIWDILKLYPFGKLDAMYNDWNIRAQGRIDGERRDYRDEGFLNGCVGYEVAEGIYRLERPFNVNISEWLDDKANAECIMIGASANEDDEECTVCYFTHLNLRWKMDEAAKRLNAETSWVFRVFESPYKFRPLYAIDNPDRETSAVMPIEEEIETGGIRATHVRDGIYKLKQPMRTGIYEWMCNAENQDMYAIITDVSDDKKDCTVEYVSKSEKACKAYAKELNKSVITCLFQKSKAYDIRDSVFKRIGINQ